MCIRDRIANTNVAGLSPTEKEELESLLGLKWDAGRSKYIPVTSGCCFGNWNFEPGTSFEKASIQNIRKTINNIIVILQSRELIQFESMDKDQYRQHFSTSTSKKHAGFRGAKADALVIHFTQKLLGEIGKSEYTHFRDRKEHAIYRFLRGASDRWMYSPPQSHEMNSPPKGGGFLEPQLRGIASDSYRKFEELKTPMCKANASVSYTHLTLPTICCV